MHFLSQKNDPSILIILVMLYLVYPLIQLGNVSLNSPARYNL